MLANRSSRGRAIGLCQAEPLSRRVAAPAGGRRTAASSAVPHQRIWLSNGPMITPFVSGMTSAPAWGLFRRSREGGPVTQRQRRFRTAPSQHQAAEPSYPDVEELKEGYMLKVPALQKRWMEQSADALMDDRGAADTVADLLSKCMEAAQIEDPDNDHPFTVFYIFHVPFNRSLQFEAWVQHTISMQGARFPGYKGTLIYRPDSNTGSNGEQGFSQYMVDVRYRGAANMLAWIQSRERDLLYTQAENLKLWLPETTKLRVLEGNSGSVSSISQDVKTQEAHRQTALSYWRVVVFKSLCVWLAVMPCNWPGCSLSATLKGVFGLSKLQTHTISVTVAVAVVVYVLVPFFQPFVSHLLVERTKDHPDVIEASTEEQQQHPQQHPQQKAPVAASASKSGDDEELELFTYMETMEEHRAAAAFEADKILQAFEADAELALLQSPSNNNINGSGSGSSSVSTAASSSSSNKDGLITAVLSHHVKPGKFVAFEDACQELAGAAEGFEGFVGHTLMRPPPGDGTNSNVYTLIFRFESREAMEAWLGSEERNRFAARLYKLVQSPAEVQVHNYSVVDLMLTSGYTDTADASSSEKQQAPPPKWKTFALITFSLYLWSLVSIFVIGPALLGMGWPFPLVVLVTSFFNCGSHSYTTTPYLSRVLAPWLKAPTPIPSWIDANHPLVRWPIQGFTRAELASMITGYLSWVVGRSFHPFRGATA